MDGNTTLELIWATVITGAVGIGVSYIKSYLEKLRQRDADMEQERQQTLQSLVATQALTEASQREIMVKLDGFDKRFERNEQLRQLLKQGEIALLKDRLVWSAQKFMKQQWIPMSQRETLTNMFNAYKSMGGNGVAEYYFNELMKLKVKDDGSHIYLSPSGDDEKLNLEK